MSTLNGRSSRDLRELALVLAFGAVLGAGAAVLALRRGGSASEKALKARQRERLLRSSAALPDDPLWEGCGLSAEEVERFGRQIVLNKIGPAGQAALRDVSVLVVGAGGLGCPVSVYICAAGVGRLGIADDDTVAESNLHRQIGHSWERVGENKAWSLRKTCLALNDSGEVVAIPERLGTVERAIELFQQYDLIIDCTDAPPSRYLINDAAVAAGKPLITVSAVGMSGQLAVYNCDGGPCLRCVFPVSTDPVAAAAPVASCEENGVLGPAVGTMGTLAALEAIKLIAGGVIQGTPRPLASTRLKERMLLFDALDAANPFRTMKLSRRADCELCGSRGKAADLPNPALCQAVTLRPGEEAQQLDAQALQARLRAGAPTVLLDVRAPSHFVVAHLWGATNWPLPEISRLAPQAVKEKAAKLFQEASSKSAEDTREAGGEEPLLVCICRRGNASMAATRLLRSAGVEAWNLRGGLRAFSAAAPKDLKVPQLT